MKQIELEFLYKMNCNFTSLSYLNKMKLLDKLSFFLFLFLFFFSFFLSFISATYFTELLFSRVNRTANPVNQPYFFTV